jgi:saccharopine dehydrogenase-like NADP-dependent oxidoreductase
MKILIVGGYGNFGKRLTQNLVAFHQHQLIVAGRTLSKAKKLQAFIKQKYSQSIDVLPLDVFASNLEQSFAELAIDLVVNASGPFQFQSTDNSYRVARACIAAGCHYIDLADDRQFVKYFVDALNEKAIDRGVMLVTGASTVPALTDAVLSHYKPNFSKLESLRYGISPGNKTERGEGTIASILSYTGKP